MNAPFTFPECLHWTAEVFQSVPGNVTEPKAKHPQLMTSTKWDNMQSESRVRESLYWWSRKHWPFECVVFPVLMQPLFMIETMHGTACRAHICQTRYNGLNISGRPSTRRLFLDYYFLSGCHKPIIILPFYTRQQKSYQHFNVDYLCL